jgi:hypothetical protein
MCLRVRASRSRRAEGIELSRRDEAPGYEALVKVRTMSHAGHVITL